MRMRKKQWAEPFLEEHSDFVVAFPELNKGKWHQLLCCDRLHVEIGCGKGDYLIQMGQMYPQEGWIGIERERNVAAVATKKALEQEYRNQRLIALDADEFENWFEEGEIDVIHLNFSDPWPKQGYAKRRLSHRGFLSKYERCLSKKGQLIMKTDNQVLFEFSLCELSAENWNLLDVSVDFRKKLQPEDAVTEYESRFMALGQPIYRAVWMKKKRC